MRLETVINRPLDSEEKLFKNAYLHGDKSLWESAMTFSRYEELVQDGRILITENSHYLKDKSVDNLGVTVNEVDNISNAEVTLHRRYSYPVLHNHNYVEIIYIADGHCTNCFENINFEMNKGDVCIMSPSSIHALSCTNDESCIINIMVNKEFFDQSFLGILRGGNVLVSYLENILFQSNSSPYILFPTGKDSWLLEISSHLLTEALSKPHAYEQSISLLTSEFLLHLVREYEMMAIVPNEKTSSKNNFIVAVLGYLSVNYNKTTLEETANFFNYSNAYLSRLIHKTTGKTFNQIITELQMEHACELFKKGITNLTDVAQEVGCYDSSHFSKKFKLVYGISPTDYLRNIRISIHPKH